MTATLSRIRRRGFYRFLAAALVLVLAVIYGRTRAAPDPEPLVRSIFLEAATIQLQRGVHHVYGPGGELIGWAGTGSADGYGGPMVLMVGVDTLGQVAGLEVVQQRESPMFWRMARAPEFFEATTGAPYDGVDYDYGTVVAATGATLSTTAIVESTRASIALVAGEAFDVRLPAPRKSFEFGLLEIVILALFAAGIVGSRLKGPVRRRIRWGAQITGLVVLGFWKDSPITLAKIAAFMSGYFPDPRTSAAVYLLLAGFLVSSILYGRNLYCLYACPFGAAQRVVGKVGGLRLKLPRWSVRLMGTVRNIIVFAALFMAFLSMQPALASYEPFAVIFSLNGTTLQWILLFVVLVASLAVHTPWCAFFCPMRTVEQAIQRVKWWLRGRSRKVVS